MELYNDIKDFFNKFSIIVAASENGTIGKNNSLLWHLPNDLKRFKLLTDNKIVIMGKNTYLSLPNGALANRINVVVSNDDEFLNKYEKLEYNHTGLIKLKSIFDVFNFIYDFEVKKLNNHEMVSGFDTEEYFIIGGGMMYDAFLPIIKHLYLTKVHTEIDGDAYLPDLTKYVWKLLEKEEHKIDFNHLYDYTFLKFEKVI